MRLTQLASLLVIGLMLVGCTGTEEGGSGGGGKPGDGNSKSGSTDSNLSGQVKIDGSSTVEPISNRAGEMFKEKFSKVNVPVTGQGSSNGFKSLAAKNCDISDASRPIKQKEVDKCKEAGVKFYEVPVAYDGLTVVVNVKNDFVKSLTVDQLKKIFREDMAAKTWKDVDASWPDETIAIYSPGTASGTHDYFVEVIGKKDKKGHRPAGDQVTMSEDDKSLVTGVEGNQYAIGFFGYSYYDANRAKLKAVPIINPATDKPVTPSIDTIESGEYAPFSRPLFIYVNAESYQRNEVKEFVDFYLENVVSIVKDAGYVPLPAEIYQAGKDRIAKDMPGTHYLDADGNKREGGIVDVYKPENISE